MRSSTPQCVFQKSSVCRAYLTAVSGTGSNYSVHDENVWLRPNMSMLHPEMPPVVPGFNCTVHNAQNYSHIKDLLANAWTQ